MDPVTPEQIRIRWAGTIVTVTVLRRYANGRIRVEHHPHGSGWDPTGRFGTVRKPERMTIDPWQVVPDDPAPTTTGGGDSE